MEELQLFVMPLYATQEGDSSSCGQRFWGLIVWRIFDGGITKN